MPQQWAALVPMRLRGIGYAFAAALMFGLGAVLAKLLGGNQPPTIYPTRF